MLVFLQYLLDPAFLGGLILYCLIFTVLSMYVWRRPTLLSSLLMGYFLICASIILFAYMSGVTLLTLDAIERYIPSANEVYAFFEKGWFNIVADFDQLGNKHLHFPGYTIPLGFFLYIFQNSLIALHLFSTIFGLLIIYQLYQITAFLYEEKTARLAALMLAFSPYFIFLSSLILRDTFGIFLILWFFRNWQLFESKGNIKYVALMCFAIFVQLLIRPPIGLLLIGIIVIEKFLYNKPHKSVVPKIIKIIICIILGLGVLSFLIGSFNSNSFVLKGLKYAQLEYINQRTEPSYEAGSTYLENRSYSNYAELLRQLPQLIYYFLCVPFPWQVKSASQAVALIDSSVLWVIYILFFCELRNFIKKNRKWSIIIFSYFLLGITSSALLQGNIAGAQRHRLLFTVLIIPFAAHKLLSILDNNGFINSYKVMLRTSAQIRDVGLTKL